MSKKPFELTNIDCAVDEEVLRGVLKDNNMFLTFYGSRMMALLIATSVLDPQYEYAEKHGIARHDLINDNLSAFVYNPHDKHMYITIAYSNGYYARNAGERKELSISFKVGKGTHTEIIDQAEVERVEKDPDSCKVIRAVTSMDDL